MTTLKLVSVSLIVMFVLAACTGNQTTNEVVAIDRPDDWASLMNETPGLSNFYKVSNDLYRGAQPEEEGFAELQKLGIKTVVNLRTLHSDREDCSEAGLKYVHISFQAWEGEDDEVIDFLRVIADPENHPVFVHCQHGADRTGVMSAVYRIAIQGWSKEETIREMIDGGYGFHGIWQNLIDYVEELDVDQMKARAAID